MSSAAINIPVSLPSPSSSTSHPPIPIQTTFPPTMSSAAINIPVSLPSPSSSASSGSPNTPATPLTPNSGHHVTFANKALPLGGGAEQFNFNALNLDNTANNPSTAPTTGNTAANTTTNGGPVRRKTSRRANTAERRATHNAVERQRRETLNGRFLDLAALLPNLASVRRPSKSAIVNSSIALIHTHRRSRATAARELRLLKLEADALRAEVNEWRERAGMGLTRIEEPARTRDFEELVSGGLEEAEEGLLEAERRALEIVKEGLRMDDMGNDGSMGPFAYGVGAYGDDDDDDSSDGQGNRLTRPGSQGSAHSIPSMNMPVAVPRQNSVSNPAIFDPSAALLQSHPTHNAGINAYNGFDFNTQSLGLSGMPATKGANQWQSGLFTPQQTYAQPASFGSSPSAASFLGGFGLRADDDASSTSDVGSVVGFDLNQVNVVHPGLAQHRSRSSSSLANLQTAGLKAGTPPISAATYADSNTAGDAFAAAYSAFPSAVPAVGRIPGGGNVYGAAMGLFM